MIVNHGDRVALKIDDLFEGLAGRQGNQIAFVAMGRPQIGILNALLDGATVRLFVSRAPGDERSRAPLMIAQLITAA